jgi:ferrochelatase
MCTTDKQGVLLVQLGTPAAPTEEAVRDYLKAFLSDPLVIQKPRWLWLPILHGIILRMRPAKSAKLYQSIWTDQGSPLEVITKKQAASLQTILPDHDVRYAMTYGQPAIADTVLNMRADGVGHITVIPMYPQYSTTTTEPIVRQVKALGLDAVDIIYDFYGKPGFEKLWADKIRQQWLSGDYQKLVMSYHGVPLEYVEKGDPYTRQCDETTHGIEELLRDVVSSDDVVQTFQSKFGQDEWVSPATSDVLKGFPTEGVERVLIATPAFTTDCLETLHEICVENRNYFEHAGGKTYDVVPPLNDDSDFIEFLTSLF